MVVEDIQRKTACRYLRIPLTPTRWALGVSASTGRMFLAMLAAIPGSTARVWPHRRAERKAAVLAQRLAGLVAQRRLVWVTSNTAAGLVDLRRQLLRLLAVAALPGQTVAAKPAATSQARIAAVAVAVAMVAGLPLRDELADGLLAARGVLAPAGPLAARVVQPLDLRTVPPGQMALEAVVDGGTLLQAPQQAAQAVMVMSGARTRALAAVAALRATGPRRRLALAVCMAAAAQVF